VTEKGVQILLDAAPAVLSACPGARFIIVGTGYYLDEMRGKAHHLGISHHVQFMGYVSDDDLKKLYKIANVVCIPSLYEPF
ncbi:glycosyltransferase, partial [Acinetobacter baumannii]